MRTISAESHRSSQAGLIPTWTIAPAKRSTQMAWFSNKCQFVGDGEPPSPKLVIRAYFRRSFCAAGSAGVPGGHRSTGRGETKLRTATNDNRPVAFPASVHLAADLAAVWHSPLPDFDLWRRERQNFVVTCVEGKSPWSIVRCLDVCSSEVTDTPGTRPVPFGLFFLVQLSPDTVIPLRCRRLRARSGARRRGVNAHFIMHPLSRLQSNIRVVLLNISVAR